MGQLSNRNIILGITGSIAAYKTAELVRTLTKQGADVRVIMTTGAQEFITPLTLQALSKNPVHTNLLDTTAEAAMSHIELARWAHFFIIAPATADCIARLAAGRADDLLTTCALASAAPMFVAPAMNQQMWRSPAIQENTKILAARGVNLLGPESGEQACGDTGAGRLVNSDVIVKAIQNHLGILALAGIDAVITAGPTREPLDPVRFISNHSSGKMGYALAEVLVESGAETTLISGPTNLAMPNNVKLIRVQTALEMHEAALTCAPSADIFIGTAAVSDFRAQSLPKHKIKRNLRKIWTLNLIPNPDIVGSVSQLKNRPKIVMGFAAETVDCIENARHKLKSKSLDYIFVNDVSNAEIGFNSDQNAGVLLNEAQEEHISLRSKYSVARKIINRLSEQLATNT